MKEKNAIILSVLNNKGGVGKTMTSQNLSAALALKGKKVCMIDFDSQHNLTNRYENEDRGGALSERNYADICIEDYLTNEGLELRPIEVKKNLFLIPSTIRLAELSALLYSMKVSERASEKLKDLCSYLRGEFDYIVIDSEPGMSALMVNAAIAADLIIIPVNDHDALAGAGEGVFNLLDQNKLSTPYYFLQTMYEERFKSCRLVHSTLLESAYEQTFKTVIKRNEYLKAATTCGMDVFEYAEKSGGANQYKDLALEVMAIAKRIVKKA